MTILCDAVTNAMISDLKFWSWHSQVAQIEQLCHIKNKFKVHAFISFVRRGICVHESALNSVFEKLIARKWKFVQNILFWNSSRWVEICWQLPIASYRPKDYFKNWLKRALFVCHLYVVLLMFWYTGFVMPNNKAI